MKVKYSFCRSFGGWAEVARAARPTARAARMRSFFRMVNPPGRQRAAHVARRVVRGRVGFIYQGCRVIEQGAVPCRRGMASERAEPGTGLAKVPGAGDPR